jgi:hypothetical protein
VLRWRNPLVTVPVLVTLCAAAKADCSIDGAPLRGRGTDLAPGRHVVALALADVARWGGLLMFALTGDNGGSPGASPRDGPPLLLSAGDGTWKYALEPPREEGWKSVDFDDLAWPALVRVAAPPLGQDANAYRVERCAELGAICLGLPAPATGTGPVWVRRVFEVTAPEAGPAGQGGTT